MNKEELLSYIRELKISADQILREEAEMRILNELAQDKISAGLVFYGGTALRLAYDSPRFSEDIDLLKIGAVKFKDFTGFVAKAIRAGSGGWTLADSKDKRNTMFALINIKDDLLKHRFSIRIELHKPRITAKIETELRLIKSPVSAFQPLLLAPTISELARLKIEAVAERKKARDIFDLWYISQLERKPFFLPEKIPDFGKREFENELKVFLPRDYYPVIGQLYEQISRKNKENK